MAYSWWQNHYVSDLSTVTITSISKLSPTETVSKTTFEVPTWNPDWKFPTKSDDFRNVADELINLFRIIRIRTGQGRLENVPFGETSFWKTMECLVLDRFCIFVMTRLWAWEILNSRVKIKNPLPFICVRFLRKMIRSFVETKKSLSIDFFFSLNEVG